MGEERALIQEKIKRFNDQAQNYIDGDDMAIDPFLLEDIIQYLIKFSIEEDEQKNKGSLTEDEKRKMFELGITPSTFYNRIYMGWSREKAIHQPLMKPKVTKEDIKRAEKNGIKKNTFRTRVYRLKWDVEKAINTPVKEYTPNEFNDDYILNNELEDVFHEIERI